MTWLEILPKRVFQLRDGGRHASSYAVGDGHSYQLIDPSVADAPFSIAGLILTHAHADHFWALSTYRAEGHELWLHEADVSLLASADHNGSRYFFRPTVPAPPEHTFRAGQRLPVGDALVLEVWHSPGHTPGSSCLLLIHEDEGPLALFTGDTLFRGSIGRSDLPGGDEEVMLETRRQLKDRLLSLPADLPLFAGHGPNTTAGEELNNNPFLKSLTPSL